MGDACDSCPEMSNPTQVQGNGEGKEGVGDWRMKPSPLDGKWSGHPFRILQRRGENRSLSLRQMQTVT